MNPLPPARLGLMLLVFGGRVLAVEARDEILRFSYFMGNGEDGLRLATSEDGLKWMALRGGASFLQPVAGENKLMRARACCSGRTACFAWSGRLPGPAGPSATPARPTLCTGRSRRR